MKATIDRIEGKIAVLITQEDIPVVFNLPVSFLGDAREDDIIDIAITRDPETTVTFGSTGEPLREKQNARFRARGIGRESAVWESEARFGFFYSFTTNGCLG